MNYNQVRTKEEYVQEVYYKIEDQTKYWPPNHQLVALQYAKSCLEPKTITGKVEITEIPFSALISIEQLFINVFKRVSDRYLHWVEKSEDKTHPISLRNGTTVFSFQRSIKIANQAGNFRLFFPGGDAYGYGKIRSCLLSIQQLDGYSHGKVAASIKSLIQKGVPIKPSHLVSDEQLSIGNPIDALQVHADFLNTFVFHLFVKEVTRQMETFDIEGLHKNELFTTKMSLLDDYIESIKLNNKWAKSIAKLFILFEQGICSLTDFADMNPYRICCHKVKERNLKVIEISRLLDQHEAILRARGVVWDPIVYVYEKKIQFFSAL